MLTDREHKRLETLRQSKEKLEGFLDGSDWAWIKQILDNQIMLRRMMSFNVQMGSLDDCFTQSQTRGEIAGLQFFESYLEAALIELNAEIKTLLEKEREEEENQDVSDQ